VLFRSPQNPKTPSSFKYIRIKMINNAKQL